jgi:hypothetical protein
VIKLKKYVKMKKNKCEKFEDHKFEFDGGECIYCRKTVAELLDERQDKNISIIFDNNENEMIKNDKNEI